MAKRSTHIHFLLVAALLLACCARAALAAELDEVSRSLGLSGYEEGPVSRFPRPASAVAENVTVVTSEEIARLNAHTVADVLQTVPGVQIDLLQTPGNVVLYNVLGANQRHLLVQIDGVPQNFISADNLAHIGSMPAQMVERIEVIKGAASAAWGSALGGVINIITKPPSPEAAAGLVSASTGKKATGDLRAEISGSGRRFGYYLTGGALRSDGLVRGNEVDANHGFGKLAYDLPNGAKVTLAVDSRHTDAGLQESTGYNFSQDAAIRCLNSHLDLSYPLGERLQLELNARGGVRDSQDKRRLLAQQQLFFHAEVREAYQGVSAALSWGDAHDALKAGVEYEHTGIRQREYVTRAPLSNSDLALERRSAYLNATWTLGRLSLLPGVRIDQMNLLEDPVSYTLGATVRLGESTLWRGYAADGYGLPIITYFGSPNGQVQRELQRVTTVQTGIESTAVPYLWLKGTLFSNNTWNIQTMNRQTGMLEQAEQTRHGADLELRTSPLYGFFLTGAYTFLDARERRTREKLTGDESGPRQAAKVALSYQNAGSGFTGLLTGNYSNWHLTTPGARRVATLWDLHVTQKLPAGSENAPEIFFSIRNIFDAKLYQYDFHPNAPRWFEIGGRFRF